MNNYNQVTPLEFGDAKAQGGGNMPMFPKVTSNLKTNGKSRIEGDLSLDNGQHTSLSSYDAGCAYFEGGKYSSSVLQKHYHPILNDRTVHQPHSKGSALTTSNNIYKPDYSLFFTPQEVYSTKPPGLLNWIDRQYARAAKEGFNEEKMCTFTEQASKLISKAYASGKEWQNDWFQQSHVPVFSRGGPSSSLQLRCEHNGVARGQKRKHDSSGSIRQQPSSESNMRRSKNNLTSSAGASSRTQVGMLQSKMGQPRGQKKQLNEEDKKRLRLQRFASNPAPKKARFDDDEDYSNLNEISNRSYKFDKNKPVVGRCNVLEKRYLRLTSEPDPEKVRPLPVLERAYDFLMNKYNKQEASYAYFCDQFKSIRQDLKVQLIENNFTLKVYQTHARIALLNSDLGEYNQCQGGINELFEEGRVRKDNFAEFTSYRILYHLLTEDHAAVNEIKLQLFNENPSVYEVPVVKLSFDIALAQLHEDYHTFMRLYNRTEGPLRCLANEFIKRERLRALKTMCSAYNQLRLTFVVSELCLQDEDETFQFLNDFDLFNAVVLPEGDADTMYLNFKACRSIIMDHYNKSIKVDIKGQK